MYLSFHKADFLDSDCLNGDFLDRYFLNEGDHKYYTLAQDLENVLAGQWEMEIFDMSGFLVREDEFPLEVSLYLLR